MIENSKMREELLKQADENSAKMAGDNKKSIEQILARDAARVKRMKWISVCVWVLVANVFIIGGLFESGFLHTGFVRIGGIVVILRALLFLAIIFTVSFFVRSRSLQMKKIQQRLSEIEKLLQKLDKA